MKGKPATTTIRVTPELKEFLAKQAIKKDETYDEIIRRLLEEKLQVKIETENKEKPTNNCMNGRI